MQILVLNRGSSSIKCALFEWQEMPEDAVVPVWDARLEWKNSFENASLSIKDAKGEHRENLKCYSANDGLKQLFAVTSLKEVDAIGHRIVHGGSYFIESVLIDSDVKSRIASLSDLAPLHNFADVEGIEILESLFKDVPQIAVFDTAFHHSMPLSSVVYPGPYRWYETGIRRFGFHGISFQYCARRASQMLKRNIPRLIVCHLGSGASLCAIKEGKSIDTTMGFTPLEGLMMDTRSGSIDPGILLYFMRKGKSEEELSKELYEQSGLLGLSGISSDMRDVIEKMQQGHAQSALAFDVYIHRLKSLLGSLITSLSGIDALVFTAGIGENAPLVRKKICDGLAFLDLKLDEKKNLTPHKEDAHLSTTSSSISLLLIHTQEAFEIARETWKTLLKI